MTMTDLIMNFRAALLGIIPSFERVEIPWKRPHAYDEWDNVATAVYQALIVEPLRYTRPETERDGFHLTAYDMLMPTYAGNSVIEILPARKDGRMKVFHALGTISHPLDVVEFRNVFRTGLPQSDELETIPIESAEFDRSWWQLYSDRTMDGWTGAPSRVGLDEGSRDSRD
jgi:hypothetical protein